MVGRKRNLALLMTSVLLLGVLSACRPAPAEPSASELPPAPEQTLVFFKEQNPKDIPDFLDEVQKQIYESAYDFYSCFCFESGDIERFDAPGVPGTGTPAVVEQNGMRYQQAMGQLHQWSDFKEYALNVFTEDFFETLNTYSDGVPIYIDVDGEVYFLDCSLPSSDYMTETVSFEAAQQTDERITFYLVWKHQAENESVVTEERHLITMGKEDGLWKFSSFAVAH